MGVIKSIIKSKSFEESQGKFGVKQFWKWQEKVSHSQIIPGKF